MKTHSEEVFEQFLAANTILFEKIEEAINQKGARRPDYLVKLSDVQLMFEVKELNEDPNFGVEDPAYPNIGRTPGNHIRDRINGSKKQVQFGANQVIPSILLIYNNLDPVFQLCGTDELDFRTAMYGELTIRIDKRTRESSEMFHGRKNELQESKNTSFSAVGHLCDRGGNTTVTFYENIYSRVQLPFDILPSCFVVERFEVRNVPLTFS